MNQKSRMIGIKITAGIEALLSALLGYLFSISGNFISPFFMTAVICFGMSLTVLFLRNRRLGIIFISVSGGLVFIAGVLFTFVIWFLSGMW